MMAGVARVGAAPCRTLHTAALGVIMAGTLAAASTNSQPGTLQREISSWGYSRKHGALAESALRSLTQTTVDMIASTDSAFVVRSTRGAWHTWGSPLGGGLMPYEIQSELESQSSGVARVAASQSAFVVQTVQLAATHAVTRRLTPGTHASRHNTHSARRYQLAVAVVWSSLAKELTPPFAVLACRSSSVAGTRGAMIDMAVPFQQLLKQCWTTRT